MQTVIFQNENGHLRLFSRQKLKMAHDLHPPGVTLVIILHYTAKGILQLRPLISQPFFFFK